MEPIKRPVIKLIGQNGNAFNILAIMRKGLRDEGVSKERINEIMEEAMSGDYDHLLGTVMKYCEVE